MRNKTWNLKRSLCLIAAIGLTVALAACESQEAVGTVPETAPTEAPTVDIGGTQVDIHTTQLDLSGGYELDTLLAAAEQLTQVTQIELGETSMTGDELTALEAAFPEARIHYSLRLFDQVLTPDTERLDLPDMDPARTEELVSILPLLPQLKEINFVSGDGVCAYGIDDIPELDKLRLAAPELNLRVSFDLFGQTVTSEDARIEYYLVDIGNEGAETVRAVLPYLTACEYLLMDGCGVDNEVMAQLREDFPETKVVWRVWTTKPDYGSAKMMRWASFLTDTQRIRTVLVNDSTCDVLKYCVETRYVDFGHNLEISDFSFLGYMPHLEAAIIGLTELSDLTPLINCTELEYLEIYGSKVTDLSPLAACVNLKHLNISRLEVDDMTSLYGLDLERFRAVVTDIPKEQFEEYASLHPDCQMLLAGWAPHENGWRYDDNGDMVPRYALLREQMEYDIDKAYGIP